jgi:predicted ATPase
MPDRSKLVTLKLRNLGCIGPEGLEVALDKIVCLVGRNNTGKSTVLRAYELAQGSKALGEGDRCQWTPDGDFPEVELVAHIPEGIQNVDAKWKTVSDGLKLVRSRWQWRDVGTKPVRQTWDPQANGGSGDWAEDGKAGGADNVFNSRLPQPLRVDSLGDAVAEHTELLKLIIEPIANDLKQLQETSGSPLQRAIEAALKVANEPVLQYQAEIDVIGVKVGSGFKGVFPEVDIKIKVGLDAWTLDPAKSLAGGSSVRFIEKGSDTSIKQQGTGSRRVLFWALLQVRNTIVRERKAKDERQKEIAKQRTLREKEQAKAKPNAPRISELDERIQALESAVEATTDDLALPGHILLIDDPENALHPMAVRGARGHLYALAQDPNWQVMLTTHSPYFIDPLEDHTTILRIERDGKHTTPRTFRTATAKFSDADKADLRALLQLDSALAEMFFGSYPILVEGDTELAAYLAAIVVENDPLATQVSLVPANGKGLLAPLIRLLTHFRIPFGIIHDTDGPCRLDGKKNGAWTENTTIADAIVQARAAGTEVRHQVSVPDFERRLGGFEETKDKPILAYRRVLESAELKSHIKQLFLDLFRGEYHQPLEHMVADATSGQITSSIKAAVTTWAATEAPEDPRFKFSA